MHIPLDEGARRPHLKLNRVCSFPIGCTVVVANASDLFRITMSVKKTDYHDCRELAHYARRYLDGEKEFSTCLMVTAEQLNRRQLCRTYAHASSDLSDLRRRIRSYILARGIAVSVPGRDIVSEATLRELDKVADSSMRLLIDEARHQRDRMRRIKNEILKEFKDDETFQLIYSIPGFGIVTASYLSAMIIDIDRFTSPGAYAAYHGVVPKQNRVGADGLSHRLPSHTTVRAGRHTAVGPPFLNRFPIVHEEEHALSLQP